MKFLLDTCVCVSLLRRTVSRDLREKIQSIELDDACISAITEGELRFGADKSIDADREHQKVDVLLSTIKVEPFDSMAAREYGDVRCRLEKAGTKIGSNDLLIAGHARALNLLVITNNVKEFTRVPDLKVEDWG